MKIQAILIVIYGVLYAVAAPPSETENRFIKLNDNDAGHWLDEEEVDNLIQRNIRFFDVTNLPEPKANNASIAKAYDAMPDSMKFQTNVKYAISRIDEDRVGKFLTHFTSFFNRYYNSDTGVASALSLLDEVNDFIHRSNYSGNASVRTYKHQGWLQKSVIARIEGANPELATEVVILGAHLDSKNSEDPQGEARGANDNGSGTVVVLEVFRALLDSNFVPQRTIEFQWYSAEEVGLKGSADIASAYSHGDVNVVGMINFDIVGYNTGVEKISVLSDYTNDKLSEVLRKVMKEYISYEAKDLKCGYACTDHYSFTYNGFPTCAPLEAVPNPYMHTTQDILTVVNRTQLTEFTKLGLGFAIEMATPGTNNITKPSNSDVTVAIGSKFVLSTGIFLSLYLSIKTML